MQSASFQFRTNIITVTAMRTDVPQEKSKSAHPITRASVLQSPVTRAISQPTALRS